MAAADTARRPANKAAPLQLRAAYAVCRSITRASAKNFYYGFLVLPRRKRDALCAVYAFMRNADDISDAPGISDAERRARLETLMEGFHAVDAGRPTDDPVLLALANAKQRFKIPSHLLEKLVYGTTMDLNFGAAQPTTPGAPVVLYRTFDDLYQYCYHVASVVGLVCICIFGYQHPRAEKLAERTGIAFQVTNIIRDVKEDAQMGRVYLPAADLKQFHVEPNELATSSNVPNLKPLLMLEADRAREFYKSGYELLNYIDEDSRPALWTLVEIYSRLLDKIAKQEYSVLGEKVRLTTWEKVKVLAKGMLKRLK
ncbi:MAG TPA: phytoene/squalene synthase family protein [Terriglobales bacterium]|nr:phytoene/squalene synthase family protein [Terriglobales bacterium]